ncbi:hydantoinase/oxoprolinase family protein [Desulfitibacter alkalitolerans]|uniref:hydantoinase/oxoprolinase family protein n=1 Tax=Desulfitibacter alkalitolerans TaxID=264641 RepID=UPI000489E6B4|nr:hydantoinase/oxoprolinase family protein [Desulfitibacter alkalitolerans]
MAVALGIDTGGTYTDGVIVDFLMQKVVNKAKARTTRENLTIGIAKCIERLTFEKEEIKMVALSTTLATNAIVEGRGGRVGIILIGHEPIGDLPVSHFVVVPGGHNINGKELEPLDYEKTINAIKAMAMKVEAIAISGYLSIRNPEHELEVAKLVREYSELPLVCAHQLTTTLGFHERTVTAALNARLIPIITELIESIKLVLQNQGIKAPLMIVKGDGSLMSETVAIEKPIETILSGPAASIVGATFLTNIEDAIVFDMGGTTTDIALLEKGSPKLNSEGATVGGWLTRVLAADINTFGLGGDSYIQLKAKDRKIIIGPRRVWPLSYAAENYPYLKQELSMVLNDRRELLYNQKTDCFIFLRDPDKNVKLNAAENQLLDILKRGPHSLHYLSRLMEKDPNFLPVHNLENMGIIARISLTPTDILHVLGHFNQWDTEAARLGVEILANQINSDVDEMAQDFMKAIIKKLAMTILQTLVKTEGYKPLDDTKGSNIFLDKILGQGKNVFTCQVAIPIPVVAIGAPVNSYLPEVSKMLNCPLIIPDNAEVANAVGAATGKVIETIRCLIKPGGEGGYIVHLPWERKGFIDLDDACSYGMEEALKHAEINAKKAGAGEIEIFSERKDVYGKIAANWADEVYVETRMVVTAIGRPNWEEDNGQSR